MTVAPDLFVAAMTNHWRTTLHNVPSAALAATWEQLAATFNHQIAAYGTPEGERWKVLQPATGTGKSQGLALYCAMLPEADHPGVLIVTRLKAQADELAETVNRLAGKSVALAFHSDSEAEAKSLPFFPVLIITHRAYEIGLDAINKGQPEKSNWSAYTAWEATGRKLVVVDEALDIVEEAQVSAEQVRLLRAILPPHIALEFPQQIAAIDTVEKVLTGMALVSKGQEREKILWTGDIALPQEYDLTPLRRALRDIRLDYLLLHRDDLGENKRLARRYDEIIKAVQLTLESWNWYTKKLNQHTMNAARLIVPDGVTGAVVLDATASSNLIYSLFDHRADVIAAPVNARRYGNVTLHVSKGHAVGKTSIAKTAHEEAGLLLANLGRTLGADRRVLAVCHKATEAHLVACRHPFSAFDVAHWGAIDGKNAWDGSDAVVIFGLPYRDYVWSANVFMALQGLQTTAWLRSEGDRPFKNHRDIRHSLRVGQLVVNIVQAINRVRCRRVIDADGNCSPTDVFILLPDDKTGEEVLAGIVQNMPGIRTVPWAYDRAKRKVRRSHYDEALTRYAGAMTLGKRSASRVRQDLGIPHSSWVRLTTKLRDTSSDLSKALQATSARYAVEGSGHNQRAYLVRQ